MSQNSPFLVRALVAELVALAVAKDEIEQPRGLLPDDANIGFPGTVERDREQDLVLGLEDGDTDRMDNPNTLDGVGQHAGKLVFESAGAAGMRGAEHPLDARLVGHSFEGRDESFFDGREDSEVGCARQTTRLDLQIASHECAFFKSEFLPQ